MNKNIVIFLISVLFAISTGCATNEHLDEGIFFFENKNYNPAITEFRRALGQDPLNIEIHFLLAESYLRKGRAVEAKETYQTILSIDPKNSRAVMGMNKIVSDMKKKAKNLIEEEKYNEAYNMLEKILHIDVENKYARQAMKSLSKKFIELGNKFFEKKEYLDAIGNYKVAMEINPDITEISKKLIKIRNIYRERAEKLKVSDAYSAIGEYEQAIFADPSNSELRFNLGALYEVFTDFIENAATSFTKAIELDPYVSKYHAHLGAVYYKQSKFDRSRKEYLFSFKRIKDEIKKNILNKKKYKYFYSSITQYTQAVKEYEKGKGEGLYLLMNDKKKIPVDLHDEDLKAYKIASKVFKNIQLLAEILKNSKLKDSEKSAIFKHIVEIRELITNNEENLQKEKEVYEKILTGFKAINTDAVKQIEEFGKLIS